MLPTCLAPEKTSRVFEMVEPPPYIVRSCLHVGYNLTYGNAKFGINVQHMQYTFKFEIA